MELIPFFYILPSLNNVQNHVSEVTAFLDSCGDDACSSEAWDYEGFFLQIMGNYAPKHIFITGFR